MKLDLDRTPVGQSALPVTGRYNLDFGADRWREVEVDGVLRVDNLESRLVLRGKLDATTTVECGRCLEDFELKFRVPIETVILCDTGHETDDVVTPVIHQRDGEVDLDDTVREATILALPQIQVCREDCRGLCARCGTDLNNGSCECVDDEIDPRWEGLPDV